MHTNRCEEVVERHVLVTRTHVVWSRTIDDSRHSFEPPESTVGCAQANARRRSHPADVLSVVLYYSDHFVVRIAVVRLRSV